MLAWGCYRAPQGVLRCQLGLLCCWGGVMLARGCHQDVIQCHWGVSYCQGGVIELVRWCNQAVSWRAMLQFSVALWCSFVQLMKSRSQQVGAMQLTWVEYNFVQFITYGIKALWTKWLLLALSKMQLTCEQHGFVQCSAVSHSSDQNALEQAAIACS